MRLVPLYLQLLGSKLAVEQSKISAFLPHLYFFFSRVGIIRDIVTYFQWMLQNYSMRSIFDLMFCTHLIPFFSFSSVCNFLPSIMGCNLSLRTPGE